MSQEKDVPELLKLRDQFELARGAVTEKVEDEFILLLQEVVFRFQATYSIAIITALPLEFEAVGLVSENLQPLACALPDAIEYYSVDIPASHGSGKDHEVILCQTIKMGNNAAAVAATSLLKDFPTLTDLIMVGIAGGIPLPKNPGDPPDANAKNHVRLGDIIVSDRSGVIQYDMKKLEVDKSEFRGVAPSPSARLLDATNRLQGLERRKERPWEKYIKRGGALGSRPPDETDVICGYETDEYGQTRQTEIELEHPEQEKRRNGWPLVHYGTIGSANILLKDPHERDQLGREHGVRGVEMEGSGIADAAWSFGKGYLVVRGVCDYCDMNKKDEWQGYAAVVAAAYARALIERLSP